MKLGDVIEKIESSSEFAEWRKENTDSFLAHAFMMMDRENENIWQIGYYNPKNEMVTTFILEEDSVRVNPESAVFKRPDAKVDKLDIAEVKIGSVEAVETGNKVMAENYPKASPIKMFFIVQSLPEFGTVYNMTFITQDFKTVNIRICSKTGKVLRHSFDTLFDFKK